MLLSADPQKRARIITVIACTTIALACGTNVCGSLGPADNMTDHVTSMDIQYGVQVSLPVSNCPLPTVT